MPLDKSGAVGRLPPLDMKRPHLIAGEMKFVDGFVTRRELVVGGELTDTADAEMTPIAVRQTAAAPPANRSDCFTGGGSPVRVAAVENLPALVIFVLDPDPEWLKAHLARLRSKLDSAGAPTLANVRGVGYRLG